MTLILTLIRYYNPHSNAYRATTGWAPKSKVELQAAIRECLKLSTDCSESWHGPIGSWDVSAVSDMSGFFFDGKYNPVPGANKFNGDISKWDVSRVTTMWGMFYSASSFNGDISEWDVSSVINMDKMFYVASSFAQTLCGKWLTSKASKKDMFDGSSGKICASESATGKTKFLSPHSGSPNTWR